MNGFMVGASGPLRVGLGTLYDAVRAVEAGGEGQGDSRRVVGELPRWTGWLAHLAAALCLIFVPAMFTGPIDGKGSTTQGVGPAVIANFPPLIWFLVVGVVLIRRARAEANTPVVAQQRRSV